jgi:8-oxo-dGTP pyrophosphatase MutT (NUDIX family)
MSQGKPRIPRWPTVQAHPIEDYGVFRVQKIERRSPRTDQVGVYKVLRIASWVNVIAVTPEDEVLLVEHFRHGIDDLTLEIPGGVIEPGEDVARGAARELREETGYEGDPPIYLGEVYPNPAIQDNICFTFLVENARLVGELELDEGEHIEVHKVPLREIPDYLRDGRIRHSLVVAAFHWLALRRPDPLV